MCRWGCEHEKSAIEAYTNIASEKHKGLTVSPAGLFVDCEHSYIGASPDGVVQCGYCGKGLVEIKCPFCMKDGLPEEAEASTLPSSFCMEIVEDKWHLRKQHTYYYQVQTQLNVCQLSYCDFVLWTKNGIEIDRIVRDIAFYNEMIEDVTHFFIYGMLPEIIGKWYTRKPLANENGVVPVPSQSAAIGSATCRSSEHQEESGEWCFCGLPSFGLMIECDNKKCSIQWFHCECLRIRSVPKGKWYCPSCRKLPQFSSRSKKSLI